MSVHIIAAVVARPEQSQLVESALRELAAASRNEPGNTRYDLYVDASRPDAFHLVESYVDEQALAAHRAAAHYANYRSKTATWLAAPTAVHVLRAIDVAP